MVGTSINIRFHKYIYLFNMSDISQEYITLILERVANVERLKNWHYTTERFEIIAQNYFGIIIPITLLGEAEDNNSQKVRIECVLKLAPIDERYRVSGAVTAMFAREIFVYNVLFKAYKNILESFPKNLHFIIPHCYYVQEEYCKEAIVMENMVNDGFKPFTCQMFLTLDHIIVSLKSLAKLHGLSFIIENKNKDMYSEMSKKFEPLTENTNKRYMDVMRNRLEQAIKKFDGTEYIPMLQNLRQNCAQFFDCVTNSVQKTCLCHGDIWKENILYKYENNKPVSACLIDYQSVRISCPAFDTLYLIMSSTSTETRQNHYKEMLDIYYQTFADMIKEGGLDSNKVYSRQMFDQDLRVVAPGCIITANCALWLSNGLQEEGHVRSKIVLSTQEEKDTAVQRYKNIVKAIIDDCCSYGYISL